MILAVCASCSGKGFLNAEGTSVYAYKANDSDKYVVCSSCEGTGRAPKGEEKAKWRRRFSFPASYVNVHGMSAIEASQVYELRTWLAVHAGFSLHCITWRLDNPYSQHDAWLTLMEQACRERKQKKKNKEWCCP